jgi:hypothetical protein
VTDGTRTETRYVATCDTCADTTELSMDRHVVAYAELTAFFALHKDCPRFSVRMNLPPQAG